ncbi:hypothetical protein [Natronogracilivirga saccharolytica]|nr:hypothetical protein [Natronogracilivirga saccharolytica]
MLNDINSTFRSPALSSSNRVLKWAIWVTARIKFTSDEAERLDGYNFDGLTSPLEYEMFTGELELINFEIVDPLPEQEITKRIERLRTELNDKLLEIQESLVDEFDFQIEN